MVVPAQGCPAQDRPGRVTLPTLPVCSPAITSDQKIALHINLFGSDSNLSICIYHAVPCMNCILHYPNRSLHSTALPQRPTVNILIQSNRQFRRRMVYIAVQYNKITVSITTLDRASLGSPSLHCGQKLGKEYFCLDLTLVTTL